MLPRAIREGKCFAWRKNPLIKNGLIFFSGSMAISAGNYIFHLVLGRMLGPADYGILASLISLSVILSIPMSTVQTVIIKIASNCKVSQNYGRLRFVLETFLKNSFLAGLIFLAILYAIAGPLARFLKIPDSRLIFFLGFLLLLCFLIPITRGILQGLQKFKALSLNFFIEALVKTILAIFLVIIGFKVYGALLAIILSTLAAFIASFRPLKFIFAASPQKTHFRKAARYSLPVFCSLFFFALLYNLDVVLVKHFLPEQAAGLYSALSKLGQIIFFATGAISAVMFPMVAEKYQKGENHNHLLIQSLKIVSIAGSLAVIFYFVFPNLVIRLLFGASYLAVAPLAGLFALAMLFLSLINILISYHLSIHSFKFIFLVAGAGIAEILLIAFYHHSLGQVVMDVLFSLGGLLASLLLFYFWNQRKISREQKFSFPVIRK